ncbi:MAG: hypothetical protein K2L80_03460, partial [Muribaculaceae bacterium]|nr:hypothetical protein [Muribaculaceae bacterium]
MKFRLKTILAFLIALLFAVPAASADDAFVAQADKDAREAVHDMEKDTEDAAHKLDPKDIIFEHLGDGYGWEVPFDHHHRIPLPVIVWASDGLHVFSSGRVTGGQTYRDGNLEFKIAGHDTPFIGKVVDVLHQ